MLGPLILTLFNALRSASLEIRGQFILQKEELDMDSGEYIFSVNMFQLTHHWEWLCYPELSLAGMGVIWQSGIGSWRGGSGT